MELTQGYIDTIAGVIPDSWEADVMGNIVPSIFSGKSKTKSDRNGIYPIYGSTGIIGYSDNPDYEGNTILIARVGANAGTINIVDGKYCVSDNTLILRIDKKLDICFIYNYLKYFNLNKLVFGSGQPLITGSQLRQLPLPIPPVTEQRAIATALSDIDSLINSLTKLIIKKKSIKQGAMQELLTGKKRLEGFSGEWLEKPLGDLFDFNGGYTASRDQLSRDGYCYLHYGDIHGSNNTVIDVETEFLEIPKLKVLLNKISKNKLLQDGDVVFVDASEDDEGTSRHIIVSNPNDIPFISGLHTIVSKSKNDLLDNGFKQYCFQSTYIKNQFKFYAVGTKVSGVSKTSVAKIKLRFPDLIEEQKAIAKILLDMDSEIRALDLNVSKYKEIKQGMMQELLTGRIRLLEEAVQ